MQRSEAAPTIECVLYALDVEHPIVGAVSLAGLIATRFGVTLKRNGLSGQLAPSILGARGRTTSTR